MKCFKHSSADAVGTCQTCGRGMCKECASIVDQPICLSCALEHNAKLEKDIKLKIIGTAIAFLLPVLIGVEGLFRGHVGDFLGGFIWGIILVLFFWGYSVFPSMPIAAQLMCNKDALVFLFILRCVLSPFVGLFYAPFRFYAMWKDLRTSANLKTLASNIEQSRGMAQENEDIGPAVQRNRLN